MIFPKIQPHLSETCARVKFNRLRALENCYKIKMTLDALGRKGTVFERKATGLRRSHHKILKGLTLSKIPPQIVNYLSFYCY